MPENGWTLPETINPQRVCIQLEIPNDFHHIAAFWGAMLSLSYWFNWQRDDQQTAKKVADVWWDIFLRSQTAFKDGCPDIPVQPIVFSLEDDMPLFRQDGCLLQVQCANGDWETIYDPTQCITDGSTQPPASGALAFGECRTLQAVLQGNGRYLIPFKVGDGYAITVTAASGGWHDGTFLSVNPGGWYCPNGQQYELGACAGFGHTYSTDPLPTVEHMRLIGGFGTTYTDMFNQTYLIPSGSGDVDFWFQPNDDPTNDNSGSITFTLEVCNRNTAPALFHTYDLTISDYGWLPDQTFVHQSPVPVWTAGTGFLAPLQDGGSTVPGAIWGFLYKDLTAFNLVSIEMTFDNSIVSPGAISYVGYGAYPEGNNARVTAPPTGVNVLTYMPPPLTSVSRLIAGISGNNPTVMHITKLVIGYTGTPPIW